MTTKLKKEKVDKLKEEFENKFPIRDIIEGVETEEGGEGIVVGVEFVSPPNPDEILSFIESAIKEAHREALEEMEDDINQALKKSGYDIRLGLSNKTSIDTMIRETKREARKEVVEEIRPRLYHLWANTNGAGKEEAKELLNWIEALNSKSGGK